MIADMAAVLGILVAIVALAACLWLAFDARRQVAQLRVELDQTQRLLNETRQQLDDLKAAAEVMPAPPPLPKARPRTGGLDDLREQLRAAHREESDPASEE